jgi:hypothetical protein
MKKIGIITFTYLHTAYNYGSILQNYAMERVIASFGYEPESLVIRRTFINKLFTAIAHPQLIPLTIHERRKRQSIHLDAMKKIKDAVWHSFVTNKMHICKIDKQDINIASYKVFIAGSDQIWNPYNNLFDKTFFLDFAPKDKRISYAASFGIEEIPKMFRNYIQNQLTNMSKISVREERGVEIVAELVDRDATLVVDPTMLLSPLEWIEFSTYDENSVVALDEKYIFVYTLSKQPQHIIDNIEQFASAHEFKIVQIMANEYNSAHKVYSPPDFVKAIMNAEFVVTDSFHGTAFSIIMKCPFICLNRTDKDESSRFASMLSRFSLKDNVYSSENSFENAYQQTIFASVDDELLKGRDKGHRFLRESLNLLEGDK